MGLTIKKGSEKGSQKLGEYASLGVHPIKAY